MNRPMPVLSMRLTPVMSKTMRFSPWASAPLSTGMVRGMKAIDQGGPISVPVGRGTLGRVMNVIGEPVDQLGPIEYTERMPIHRLAPAFDEQATSAEMFETGVKVIDLIQPFLKGGKIGLFGGAGVGKTVVIME